MSSDLSVMNMIKDQLEVLVKETVTEQLIKDKLDEYEKELKEIIAPLVESISFDSIETLKDMMHLRDEIRIVISTNGELKEKTI